MVTLDIYVEAPPLTPPRGGILAVADVHLVSDPHFGTGSISYSPQSCAMPELAPQDCWTTLGPAADTEKTLVGIPADDLTTNFNIYSGVECFTDFSGSSEYTDRARAQLEAGQGDAIAKQLRIAMQARAVDLSASVSADDWVDAVGTLEQFAGSHYPGLPVLHADRKTVARWSSLNLVVPGLDWTLTTVQGTPIANDAGYGGNDGATLPFAYISGAVHVWLGPVTVSEAFDRTLNTQMALAERRVGVSVDCFAAYVDLT